LLLSLGELGLYNVSQAAEYRANQFDLSQQACTIIAQEGKFGKLGTKTLGQVLKPFDKAQRPFLSRRIRVVQRKHDLHKMVEDPAFTVNRVYPIAPETRALVFVDHVWVIKKSTLSQHGLSERRWKRHPSLQLGHYVSPFKE
jgi:hypothetical protein